MRPRLATILLLGLTQTAQAQTIQADAFAARMAAGQTAAATAAGDAFAQSVTPLLQIIDGLCDPPGTVLPPADLGPLDLVADITPHGVVTNIEVRPQTATGTCFAAHLAAHRFAPPPWQGNYPVFIHLTVSN